MKVIGRPNSRTRFAADAKQDPPWCRRNGEVENARPFFPGIAAALADGCTAGLKLTDGSTLCQSRGALRSVSESIVAYQILLSSLAWL